MCQALWNIHQTHILEVGSNPAKNSTFIYKTKIDDDLDDAHEFIYLSHDFIFCQVELRIAVRPLDYIQVK